MIALSAAMTLPTSTLAADEELGALALESAPVESMPASATPTRLFVESALGRTQGRSGAPSRDVRRVSVDLVHASRIAPGWHAVVSDRLDHIRPAEPGSDATLNSLREGYLSWSDEAATAVVEVGRINVRNGPGYGYNPTDFFRDGALRAVTTANPFALRENRMGTVALRAQKLWSGGSVTAVLSPKLDDARSGKAFSLDLGATNNRNRGLLTLSQQWSDRVSGQVLLYKDSGSRVQPGASLTALLSDAVVGHFEWSSATGSGMADGGTGVPASGGRGHRLASGLTFTTSTKLSLTAELQFNGLSLGAAEWDRLARSNPLALGTYLLDAQRQQELAPRRAYMLYATQRDAGIKNLDLTAFLRVNAVDHSRLAWLDVRYHWPKVDLAIQWQQTSGSALSEYGFAPERRNLQALLSFHLQ